MLAIGIPALKHPDAAVSANIPEDGQDLRQGRSRDFEELQEFIVPRRCPQVEKLCARGVAQVGCMNVAGRKIPKKPAIHGAQADVLCRLSRGLDLLEQPTRLACGEKRVNGQSCSVAKKRLQTLLAKVLAKVCRAAALPDHCRSKRLPAGTIPRQDCFPLVRNSDRREFVRRDLTDAALNDSLHRFPNGERILLDPSRLRKRDLHGHRGPRHDLRFAINNNGFGVRRPLVNRQDKISGHGIACLYSRHQQTNPPSTMRSIPVQKEAAWLERKTAGPTISSTVAIRPSGVSASNCLTCSATSGRRFIGVAV